MRCPKCGLTSFDYNDACPKCGRDLTPLREQLGLLNLAPQPIFFLAALLGEEEVEEGAEEKDFTFEQSEDEDLGAYQSDSTGVRKDDVSAEDIEEVATLEFEADMEDEAEEQGIAFNMPAEEPTMEISGEEEETGRALDFSENDETLILEPEEMGLQLEIETETEQAPLDEGMEKFELEFDSDTEEEPLRTDNDELDLAALDLEPEALDFSDIESEPDSTAGVPFPSEETVLRGASDPARTITVEPEEATSDDKGTLEMDLAGLSVEEEQVLAFGEDQSDDQSRILSDENDLDDLASHLEDETLVVEDTDESLVLEDSEESESRKFYDSDDEDDLDEIELDFDDLELELEEDN